MPGKPPQPTTVSEIIAGDRNLSVVTAGPLPDAGSRDSTRPTSSSLSAAAIQSSQSCTQSSHSARCPERTRAKPCNDVARTGGGRSP